MRKSLCSDEQQLKERNLIAEITAGSERAFEELYQLYFSRLYQFIFQITRNQDAIEEVINDVMFVVWEKASTYDRICRPSTWILGIAYFKAIKRVEQNIVRQDRVAEFDDELDYFPERSTQWISQLETDNWLESALSKLSAEHRAVVEMTYYQGLHYNEISEIMQCPENTVKTRMFHARKVLAKLFMEFNDRV